MEAPTEVTVGGRTHSIFSPIVRKQFGLVNGTFWLMAMIHSNAWLTDFHVVKTQQHAQSPKAGLNIIDFF